MNDDVCNEYAAATQRKMREDFKGYTFLWKVDYVCVYVCLTDFYHQSKFVAGKI